MKKQIEKLGEFNKAFNVKEQETPSARILDDDKSLCYKLMTEELEEYWHSMVKGDIVEVCDALIDMQYVLLGMFRKHGISLETIEKMFDEVHASNMSKLGDDGKPILRDDGKILKGKNYFKPNLEQYLERF